MATHTVENYVKTIYQISAETGQPAATGEIARRLNVSPGSVTSMLRTLSDSELAHYQAYEGVQLSKAGNALALRILRRHRLIELFLVRTLGLTWDEVHDEAEQLEHAVSDGLIDRIDSFLQHPERDPHGDPIPKADGSVKSLAGEPLTGCDATTRFVLERVLDQSPAFLRYLSDSGLEIGSEAVVTENHPSAGAVIIATDTRQISLGRDAADSLLVRRLQR